MFGSRSGKNRGLQSVTREINGPIKSSSGNYGNYYSSSKDHILSGSGIMMWPCALCGRLIKPNNWAQFYNQRFIGHCCERLVALI